MKIELQKDEEALRKEVADRVREIGMAFREGRIGNAVEESILEAGRKAHELHMKLKARGLEPRHHRYMVENRELPIDHPKFYMHYHPLEDLLKFLTDPTANDDPEDQTIGMEFQFSVYSKRWGRNDTYRITRTEDGWDVGHIMIGGPCDKAGKPFLFQNFRQDHIQYPNDLGGWLEWLWDKAEEEGLSFDEVQAGLNDLADWVTVVEQNRPQGDIWFGY